MTVDAHSSGDQSRHAQQSGKVEDVRPQHHADTGVLVSRNDRRHRRGDLRCVGAERSHHAEQRFGEAEPLADPIEVPSEHDTGSHGEQKRGHK